MANTVRLKMPLLMPGQAQKEITHNEALTKMDMLLHPCINGFALNAPPAALELGECWIVGAAPQGEWLGKAHSIACWTEGGWRFVQPFRGLLVSQTDDGMFIRWDGESWVTGQVIAEAIFIGDKQVLGPRQPAIEDPANGSVVDVEARSSIANILDVLRTHGMIAGAL